MLHEEQHIRTTLKSDTLGPVMKHFIFFLFGVLMWPRTRQTAADARTALMIPCTNTKAGRKEWQSSRPLLSSGGQLLSSLDGDTCIQRPASYEMSLVPCLTDFFIFYLFLLDAGYQFELSVAWWPLIFTRPASDSAIFWRRNKRPLSQLDILRILANFIPPKNDLWPEFSLNFLFKLIQLNRMTLNLN